MAWNMSALNAGIGFGALIGGVIINNFDVAITPYVSIFFAVICILLAYVIKR